MSYHDWTIGQDNSDIETNPARCLPPSNIGGSCSLSGSLDQIDWSRFTRLVTLYLADTGISGSIPNSLATLPSLQIINLSDNSLRGAIPSFTGVRFLALSANNNQLSGDFASILFSLPSDTMQLLSLGGNSITGFIPDQIESYTTLFYIDISNNGIGGTVPDTIGQLTGLQGLILESNQFQGTIPDALASSMPRLTQLRLHDNFFQDDLTAPFCSFAIGAGTTADCGTPQLVVCPCCLCYSKDRGGFFL